MITRRLRKSRERIEDPRPRSTEVIAMRLDGETAWPTCGGVVPLPGGDVLRRHLLVIGSTGSGKTETLLRLAWAAAHSNPGQAIFFIDGKGDRGTAERFCGLMAAAGRSVRVYPNEPFDAWRGDSRAIQNRLLEVVDFSVDGPAAFYRDVAKTTMSLACHHPDGPPRSSSELLRRMDAGELLRSHRNLAGLNRDLIRQVRLRYEAFFRQTGDRLDGEWSWEDTSAAYVLLDSLALTEEAANVARLLFEDFSHFAARRKSVDVGCSLTVDEFAPLARQGSMAARVEQLRGFGVGVVLATQSDAGMGSDEERERILDGLSGGIVQHQMSDPEPIAARAGTKRAIEWSQRYERGLQTGEGSARVQHQHKVPLNRVRALRPGEAYVIAGGKAMRARFLRAPEISARLPAWRDGEVESIPSGPTHEPQGIPR